MDNKKLMVVEIIYFDREYGQIYSKEQYRETWTGTDDEIFERFYKENNRLKYCNGSYFKFGNPEHDKQYREWINVHFNVEFYMKHGGDMW